MWNARTRFVLLVSAFLLLFSSAAMFVGIPGIQRIAAGDAVTGWLLVAVWLVVDAALFAGMAIVSRKPAFRSEPVDWTLPSDERRRLVREEEERYRRSKRAGRDST
jgi:small-conductance mechanosensitive channel